MEGIHDMDLAEMRIHRGVVSDPTQDLLASRRGQRSPQSITILVAAGVSRGAALQRQRIARELAVDEQQGRVKVVSGEPHRSDCIADPRRQEGTQKLRVQGVVGPHRELGSHERQVEQGIAQV